jgi:hypothetical protein
VPRDRDGSFTPVTVPKGTRRLGEFDDMILSLYAKGPTTRDIAEHLHATYGASVSHETIANITDAVNDVVKEWRSRPLEEGAVSSERCESSWCLLTCPSSHGFVRCPVGEAEPGTVVELCGDEVELVGGPSV